MGPEPVTSGHAGKTAENGLHDRYESKVLPLPYPLRLFVWTSIVLTAASLLHAILARHMGYGLPYSNSYYFIPNDRFRDFESFRDKFASFGSADFFTSHYGYFMYPAPMAFVIRFFTVPYHGAITRFVIFMVAITIFMIVAFRQILKKAGLDGFSLNLYVAAVVLLSYPLLFEFMRWNIEILIAGLVSLGLWSFWRERSYQAAIYFGLATALKFFPLIFLGLLFARRKYWETALGLVVVALVTLLALRFLGPTIPQAFAWDNQQMTLFREHFAGVPYALGYDHSLFAFLKWIMLPRSRDLTAWVTPYTRTVAVGGLVLYFARIWRLPAINQIIVLSVLAVTLAPVSFDYTLLSLYAAFLLLSLRALRLPATERQDSSELNAYFFLFAIIFTPLSFVVWNGGRYAGQLRLLALITVVLLALIKPLRGFENA